MSSIETKQCTVTLQTSPMQWYHSHFHTAGPPSSVVLHFGEPILTGFETTTVECTAVGGEPVEAYNLTLWRNGELLAHVIGSHLSHMTTPYQYGAYRCSVDNIHETAILMERGEGHATPILCLKLAVLFAVLFQLLLDGVNTTKMECQQVGNIGTPASPWIWHTCMGRTAYLNKEFQCYKWEGVTLVPPVAATMLPQ